jgi:hypothetical protein
MFVLPYECSSLSERKGVEEAPFVYVISEIKERISIKYSDYALHKIGKESSFCLLSALCKVFLCLRLKYNFDKLLKYVIVKIAVNDKLEA